MTRPFAAFVLASCLGAASTPALAGDTVRVGVFVAASITRVAIEPEPAARTERQAQPTVGGFVAVALTDHVSVDTRVLWQPVAMRATDAVSNRIHDMTVDYVSVPVLLRVAKQVGRVRPYLVGGPEFSVKTGARLKVIPASGGLITEDETFERSVRRLNVALSGGAGVEIPAGRTSLFLEGSYSHGLLNIREPGTEGLDSAHTRTVLIVAGIRF